MKKLLIIPMLLIASYTFAQIESFDTEYIEGIKKDLKGTFKEIVEDNLKLNEDQTKIFWPVYDEYMAARSPIFEERVKITEDYMMNYYSLDDETAKDLLNRSVQLNENLLKVRKEYLDKMLEVLPAPLVGKFFQLDMRISALIDLVRMSSTPLVREED